MQSAMYSALFGAMTNEHRISSIANNLANVNTTGYKRELMSFKDTFMMFAHDEIMEPLPNVRADPMFPEAQHMARPRIGTSVTDFQQGGIKVTGAPFDLAISGEGFFKVNSPEGEEFYTRNGHFRQTADGTLITEQGFFVQGEGGPIALPEGTRNFIIAEDGRIYADNELVGQVSLVEIENVGVLEKNGHNMFRVRDGEAAVEMETDGFMAQGFLEAANVDPIYEMVNMIEAQRQFEAYAKVMQASQQLDSEATSKVGRSR